MQQALAGLRSSGCTAAAAARSAISGLSLAEQALIPSLEQSGTTLGTSASGTSSTPGAAGLWKGAYWTALIKTSGGLPGRSGGGRDTPAANSVGGCHSVLLGALQVRSLSAQAQPAEPLGSVASAATPPSAAAAGAAQSDVRQQQHQPQRQDYRVVRQEDSGGGGRGDGWEDEAEPAPIPLDPNVKPPGFLFVTTGAALSALLAVGVATLGIVGTFYAGYAISQVAKELRSSATTTGAGAPDGARSTTAGSTAAGSTTKDSGGASGSSSIGRNGAQGRPAAPEVLAAAAAAGKDGSPGVSAGAVGGWVESGGRSAATQPAARGAAAAVAPAAAAAPTQLPQGQAGTEAVGEGRRSGGRPGRSWLAWVFGFGRWRKPQQGEHRPEQVPEPAGSG